MTQILHETLAERGPDANKAQGTALRAMIIAVTLCLLAVLATPDTASAREEGVGGEDEFACEPAGVREDPKPDCAGTTTRFPPGPFPGPTPSVPPPPPTSTRPAAAVSLGDSFISGEGAGDYDDVFNRGEPAIWPGKNASTYWCYRSPNSLINVADLPGIDTRFNRACSGAIPEHIEGESSRKRFDLAGNPNMESQLDQLEALHTTHDIELVVIGIGGNQEDVGFGAIIGTCLLEFYEAAHHPLAHRPCEARDLPSDADLDIAEVKTRNAVRAVITRMESLNYQPGDFRLVVQNYTNPLGEQFAAPWLNGPGGGTDNAVIFPGLFDERYVAGCPVHVASNALGHQFAAQLNARVESAALDALTAAQRIGHDVVFLDVADAFDGDRICENAASPNGALAAPFRIRNGAQGIPLGNLTLIPDAVVATLLASCGVHVQLCQESLHPSAAGHMALGECLSEAWISPSNTRVDCDRVNGVTTTTSTPDWVPPFAGPDLVINVVWTPIAFGQGRYTVDYSVTGVPSGSATYDIQASLGGVGFAAMSSSGTFTHVAPCTPSSPPNVHVQANVTVGGALYNDTTSWNLGGQWPINFLGC